MEIRILPVALVICAAAVGFTSACLIWQEQDFSSHAVKTTAKVIALAPLADHGQLVPIVEFQDENGQSVRKKAQRFGALGVSEGEEIEIVYSRKKVFGMDMWNIFVMKDPLAKPYRLYTIMGVVMGVIAAGLGLAGIIVWLR